MDAKYLSRLSKWAGEGGNWGTVAQVGLDAYDYFVLHSITGEEFLEKTIEIGGVAAAGVLGEYVGGPVGEYIFSYIAEKIIDGIKTNSNISPPNPNPYEGMNINWNAIHN